MCTVKLKFSVRKQIIAAIVFTCILKPMQLKECSELTFNKKLFGHRLVGFNIMTLSEESIGTCANKCFQLTHCLSTNFDTVSKQCDLNNITADEMTSAVVKSGMSVLSDLSTWPKAMVGSCGDKPCNGRDICMPAGNAFFCRNSDCPKAPLVGNATSTGIKEIGGKMVYNCTEPRHRIIGLDNVQCEWMNTWSSNIGITCIADCVGLPPSPTYGKVSGTQFLENDVVTYSCNNGYILLGESTSTCTWNGTWNNVKSTTCLADCGGPPPSLTNGKVTGTHFLQGDEVTYSCNTDYMLAGEGTSTCLANGRWSNIDSTTCWPVCSSTSVLQASTVPGTFVSHADYGRSNYDNDMDSCWLIEAREGYTIDFSIMEIDQENHVSSDGNDRCYDFVDVFDGYTETDQQLGKYCGSTVPGATSSTGRYLLVHFRSDHSLTYKGFSAEYKEGGPITK